MHANAFTGRVALALGVFAPAVLAQQTAVVSQKPENRGSISVPATRC